MKALDPNAPKKQRGMDQSGIRDHAFQKGQSGNPGGKPKHSRNRLQGDFVRRLADDFERFGIYAIARVRKSDPASYLRVVASLMPKELEIKQPFDDISDDQLDAAYAAVTAILAAGSASQDSGGGADEASVVQPAQGLPALPEAG